MTEIIFATGNKDKMREIREIMADCDVHIVSMKEAGIRVDIVEDGTTFEENAKIKARAAAAAVSAGGAAAAGPAPAGGAAAGGEEGLHRRPLSGAGRSAGGGRYADPAGRGLRRVPGG